MLKIKELEAELVFMMKSIKVSIAPLTPEMEIINAVCDALQVDFHSLRTKVRNNDNVEARYIIFRLLRNHTTLSYPTIGGIFNRDHTTAMHGIKAFQDLKDIGDKKFLAKIEKVETECPGLEFFNPDKYG